MATIRWSKPGPNGATWAHHAKLSRTWDGHKPCGYAMPVAETNLRPNPAATYFADSYQFVETTNGIPVMDNLWGYFETMEDAKAFVELRAEMLVEQNAERQAA